MEKRNVTLSLPENLLRKAKVMAATHHKSLSEFLRESLEERIRESSGYRTAKLRQQKLLKEGFDLGTNGRIGFKRDEVHERR
jgi:plasmid stability protein